jgi:hypothetical protein
MDRVEFCKPGGNIVDERVDYKLPTRITSSELVLVDLY